MCPPFWPTRALAQIPTFDSAASHLSWAYHLSELKVGQAPTTDLDLTVLWVTHLLRPTRAAIFRQLHPDQHASLSFSVFLLTKPCNLHSAHTTWRPVVPAWTRGNAENGKALSIRCRRTCRRWSTCASQPVRFAEHFVVSHIL